VNLAFSIELYLKAVRILDGSRPSAHHHLDDLYAELPGPVRASLERAYDSAPKGKPGQPKSLAIRIRSTEATTAGPPAPSPSDESLRAVLHRSRDVFKVWRYLHEQGEPGNVKWLLYEFHFLGIAADVFHEHVERRLGGGSVDG